MRIRLLILIAAILFFGAVIMVPRIIEAKRDKSPAVDNSQAQGRQEMTVGESIRNDTSAPVREMKQQPVFKPRKEANENPKVPHFHKDAPDRVVQKTVAADAFTAPNMPTTNLNFNGIQYP